MLMFVINGDRNRNMIEYCTNYCYTSQFSQFILQCMCNFWPARKIPINIASYAEENEVMVISYLLQYFSFKQKRSHQYLACYFGIHNYLSMACNFNTINDTKTIGREKDRLQHALQEKIWMMLVFPKNELKNFFLVFCLFTTVKKIDLNCTMHI